MMYFFQLWPGEACSDLNCSTLVLENGGKSIGLVGGDNAVSSTRKLMATMLSPNLAQKVNWTGKNEKLPFSEMNGIRQIVYG